MAAFISFQPSDFFNVVLYTGNATADRTISGLGFQPDMAWAKSRSNTENHALFDSVRGGYRIMPDQDNAQDANTGVTAWNSDGYVIGSSDSFNSNSQNFVNWSWKAGTTSGIATNGSTTITPSDYSFSQTAGFSILKYTGNETAGAKLAHGLGAVPAFMIFKRLDGTSVWQVYHQALGNTKWLNLNETDSVQTGSTRWNNTTPDSVNVTLGTTTYLNKSGSPHVGYIFTEKKGFSNFGSYRGNGSLDGPFIYTGFRPEFILLKRETGSATDWYIWDYERGLEGSDPGPLNPNTRILRPNVNGDFLSGTAYHVDFCANGFKWRTTEGNINNSGDTFIYAAFARTPIVSSNDIPGLAK
jgi:hypothetical protein